MTTIANIAALALARVSAKITDAVWDATVTQIARVAYTVATNTYSETLTVLTGRAVFCTDKPVEDVFPDFVAGPSDQLLLLTISALAENDTVAIAGITRDVRAVQKIGPGVFYAVAR